MLEALVPAFVFIGTFVLIKGVRHTCYKAHNLYIKKKLQNIIYKKITKKPCDENCVICLDDYTENKKRVQLYCNHNFHKSCMDDWIRIKPTCPLCNTILKTKNDRVSVRIVYY